MVQQPRLAPTVNGLGVGHRGLHRILHHHGHLLLVTGLNRLSIGRVKREFYPISLHSSRIRRTFADRWPLNGRIFAEIVSAQKCLLFGGYIFIPSQDSLTVLHDIPVTTKNSLDAVQFKHRYVLTSVYPHHVDTNNSKLIAHFNAGI